MEKLLGRSTPLGDGRDRDRDPRELLEVCAVFGTLIADQDGIYDPSNFNDRLLLGLKGTMSEAELHVLKQRMLQGKLAKARRGNVRQLADNRTRALGAPRWRWRCSPGFGAVGDVAVA